MIKFYDQVPSVYPSASRDFQYLCWLIDIVLNSVKHNVDDLYDLPNSKADSRLTELLAMTLGFKVKRNYDQTQLRALVAVLPRLLKYKGTKAAVDMAGKALIAASGASGVIGGFYSEVKNGELIITFPEDLVDVALFTDLLNYILPAGMTYHIRVENEIPETYKTQIDLNEVLLASSIVDLDWDTNASTSVGLANMFETGVSEPAFGNYMNNSVLTPNIGLLDNV